ncbi:conserved hypothetical protein [Nitrospira defluvii]|uniref:Uncharacterized protein n=1 Tax=Nitrospira defluvii TaxID=330214 RepID=A0ABM8S401_9BACT|nr:conserved hypothetical protein [Nitrospira defluvii]
MLPDELPPRDPLENPPPDPPRAFAKDKVGTPTRAHTRQAAISFVVFTLCILSPHDRVTRHVSPSYQKWPTTSESPAAPIRRAQDGLRHVH